jgi:hypothetical protein
MCIGGTASCRGDRYPVRVDAHGDPSGGILAIFPAVVCGEYVKRHEKSIELLDEAGWYER